MTMKILNSPPNLFFFSSNSTSPYRNLALEEFLLSVVKQDECILYLWQNRRTVVIGVNQNPWKECHLKNLEEDGGFLARRMSGGGAVFHDLGNLNFTFLAHEAHYNVNRQLDVILCAVKKFGVQAEKSGRNDILVDGKKFSGNAFYHSQGQCFHHGTLLVDVDMSNLARYLNVEPSKLVSKGVRSVRSRVINLKDLAPQMTIELLRQAMIEAFGEIYGSAPLPLPAERLKAIGEIYGSAPLPLSNQLIRRIEEKYASWEWRLGRKLPFTAAYHTRFAWGDLTLQFCVERGLIKDAAAYSDSMETAFIKAIGSALKGIPFSSKDINRALEDLESLDPDEMLKNITNFINTLQL